MSDQIYAELTQMNFKIFTTEWLNNKREFMIIIIM